MQLISKKSNFILISNEKCSTSVNSTLSDSTTQQTMESKPEDIKSFLDSAGFKKHVKDEDERQKAVHECYAKGWRCRASGCDLSLKKTWYETTNHVQHHLYWSQKFHSKSRGYPCLPCDRYQKNFKDLATHFVKENILETFQCRKCERRFSTHGKLVGHIEKRHSN